MEVDDRFYAMSTEDIAAELGISKQRVSTIIEGALWKLKRKQVLREFAEPETPSVHRGRAEQRGTTMASDRWD